MMDIAPRRPYLARRGARHELLTKVRNSDPVPAKREDPGQSLAQMPRMRGPWSSPREYEENLFVVARAANHHGRIGRPGASTCCSTPGYTVLPPSQVREDPLKFRDSKRYTDRIKAARAKTGESDALINARGAIDGNRVVLGVQDFAFMVDRWAWRSAPPSSPARAPRSRTARLMPSSPLRAARACRKASCP